MRSETFAELISRLSNILKPTFFARKEVDDVFLFAVAASVYVIFFFGGTACNRGCLFQERACFAGCIARS